MNRRWAPLIGLLVLEHAVCVAIMIWFEPSPAWSGSIYFPWMIVPALTAAIGFAPQGRSIIAAVINGLIAGSLFDYLMFVHGFGRDVPQESTYIVAVGQLVCGFLLAIVCGGFVHMLVQQLDATPGTSVRQRMMIAARKGFISALMFVALTAPVLWWLLPGPPSGRPPARRVSPLPIIAAYALAGLTAGVGVGLLVGATYAGRSQGPIPSGDDSTRDR